MHFCSENRADITKRLKAEMGEDFKSTMVKSFSKNVSNAKTYCPGHEEAR